MINKDALKLLQSSLGDYKSHNRGEIAFFCPFCHHYKRKLQIQLDNDSQKFLHWHCWVCGESGYGIYGLFRKMNENSAKLELAKQFTPNLYSENNKKSEKILLHLPDEYLPLWKKSIYYEQKHAMSYLLKRNIREEDILRYKIGFCVEGKYKNMLVFPSYDESGLLNFFITRSFYEDSLLKYKKPPHSIDIIGYESLINWNLPIVLVEGVFDAITIRRNAIPLFGKNILSNLKGKLFLNLIKEIYIVLDKDALKDSLKIARELMDNGKNVYLVELEEKDPSEIGFENIMKIMKETKILTQNKLLKYIVSYGIKEN